MHITDWKLPAGIHAFCTTREGGVSVPPYHSLNLGDHVHDDPDAVARNRSQFAQRLGGARPVFLSQVHGTAVVCLDVSTPDGTVADACFTRQSQLACTIMVADCLPLLLTDVAGSVVAAVHAGWRGLVNGVIENTVNTLCVNAGVKPDALQVWLGPCIGPRAFEVGAPVRQVFLEKDAAAGRFFQSHAQRLDKYWADLPALARRRLQLLGVEAIAGNDSTDAWCTVQQASKFFSYRRDGVTGRFAACIWRSAGCI